MRLRATRTLTVEPWLPEELQPLRRLAENLYWSWSTDTVGLFERLDRDRWRSSGHNPIIMLQQMPREDLGRRATERAFLDHMRRVVDAFDHYINREPQLPVPHATDTACIAYFSLEFAITESIPTYSGGLGVLAGDHLKSASDLGLPLVGVCLFYRQGYFRQALTGDGWQTEEYYDLDPAQFPITRVRDGGQPLNISVPIDGRDVTAAIWRADVGGVPLFMLDTDVPENSTDDRLIAARLYGGDNETRIQQEIILGIGGFRALRAMGYEPAVCHMNEGHSALMPLERIRGLMAEQGISFDEAKLAVAASTVFTTHTAVAAGIDLFSADLVRRHLGRYLGELGISDRQLLGFGRMNPDDDNEPFSMALLGLRLSAYRNGVSKVHRGVSRRLWGRAWQNLPDDQIPIQSVTNGVHLPTWVSHGIGGLYDNYVGTDWRDDPMRVDWGEVQGIPDEELWRTHERQRESLIVTARAQYRESAARRGIAADTAFGDPLRADILTIGFARRFAAYKRATLLFRDPDRLARIVNNPDRPIQFIFAGKAHPRDEPAKQLIREVVAQSRRPEFRERIVVLERYDVELARSLVQGCDVWLNTPLRPLEASGTSGMKAVANGSLHMSVLDGWWSEAYQPNLGWAIGRDVPEDTSEIQDAFDAESLYTLLENEVGPAFYNRNADGVPVSWVQRMKASMAACTPMFSTHRMVSDYTTGSYIPAAANWHRYGEKGFAITRELASWLSRVSAGWPALKICDVDDDADGGLLSGAPLTVTIQAHWGPLSEKDVRVDLLVGSADPRGEISDEQVVPMHFILRREDGICIYSCAVVPPAGGRTGYAIRVTPDHPALPDPVDAGLVLWA
jgi:starch phosphorylase